MPRSKMRLLTASPQVEEYEAIMKKIKENGGIVKYPIEVPSVLEFCFVEGEPVIHTIACRSIQDKPVVYC
jgi:hypothetical protein